MVKIARGIAGLALGLLAAAQAAIEPILHHADGASDALAYRVSDLPILPPHAPEPPRWPGQFRDPTPAMGTAGSNTIFRSRVDGSTPFYSFEVRWPPDDHE